MLLAEIRSMQCVFSRSLGNDTNNGMNLRWCAFKIKQMSDPMINQRNKYQTLVQYSNHIVLLRKQKKKPLYLENIDGF